MRAMVLAAGLGTRLRPLTYELTKPMVPVLDRPVMEHILDLLDTHGFGPVIANLHYFPETIREYFGDRLEYRDEAELLGTAGGVRGCAEFFGDEPFLVISGDALTDIDLGALAARHAASGGIATLSVKRVADTSEFGVVLHDEDGRITGFQEKPSPDEALSDLGNCGIYVFDPKIFDYFPDRPFVDWAQDVFPRCSPTTCPSTSMRSSSTGTTWAPSVSFARERSMPSRASSTCRSRAGSSRPASGSWESRRCGMTPSVRDRSGSGAMSRSAPECALRVRWSRRSRERRRSRAAAWEHPLPGTEVMAESILIDAIAGRKGILASMRRRP